MEDATKGNKGDLAREEKKKDAIKVDLSYLEKKWGIKYKSYETESTGTRYVGPEPHRGPKMRVKIVMESTKDLEDVKDLQKAFNSATLRFYFFDEDNVVLWKTYCEGTDEITGKKGDAFRVAVPITEASLKKTRKIEVRPKEEEKDKEKKRP